MIKPMLINIVSGKGGTGKSLLCAVLARMVAQENASVLLVDFDLFVRGLSHFHYIFNEKKRRITNNRTVADFYGLSNDSLLRANDDLAIERFYEVDILPAVSQIEEQLNYLVIESNTVEKTRLLLAALKEKKYDYIFIDNRAGVDELILETSKFCDLTISVSESDPISNTTNENLLRHLGATGVGKVYTIINKMKFVRSLDEYIVSVEHIRDDFDVLGKIPFDVDLFEKFGTDTFWNNANSTRYAYALAETWNKLSKREDLYYSIDMARFPKNDLWPGGVSSPVFLNKYERLSLMSAVFMFITYFLYDFVLTNDFNIRYFLFIYGVIMLSVPMVRRLFFIDRNKSKK